MKKIFTSLFVFISLFIFNSVFATDYYWIGTVSNNYNDLSNWKTPSYTTGSHPSVLPTSSDNLFIGGASSSNYTISLNINDTINNLTIEGDGEVFINSSGGGSTLTVYGDVSNVNTNDVGGGNALIAFRSSSSQTLSGNSSASGFGKFCNITINKSGGSVSLTDFITMGGSTTLSLPSTNYATIDASHSYVCFSYNNNVRGNWNFHDVEFIGRGLVFTIYDNIVIDGSLFLTGRGGPVEIDSSTIELHGDIDNSNTDSRTKIVSTLLLSDGNEQSFKGTNDLILKKLTINKSAGAFLLTNNLIVSNNLTLTSGIIFTKSSYIISLNDNATVTGGNDTSYIDGPFSKTGNDAFSFKIGKDGKFNPFSISAPSSTSDEFVAQYFNEASSTTDFIFPITYTDPCEYWNLKTIVGSSAVNVSVGFNNPCFHIASLSYFKIARDSSGKFVSAGNCSTTGNTTTGTVTSTTARSTWGDITLAKTNALVVAHAGRDTAVCYGQSVTLGGSPSGSGGTGALTYSWSPSAGLNSSTVANPVASPTESVTYILTVTDNITEYKKDTVTITVDPKIIIDAGMDVALCHGVSTPIGGGPTADGGSAPFNYIWKINADTVSTESNPTIQPDTTATYHLIVTDDFGCVALDTTEVIVHPQPEIHVGNDTTIVMGDTVTLGEMPVVTSGTAPFNYWWSPYESLSADTLANPISFPAYSTVYSLHIVDTFGCNVSGSVGVTLQLPNQGISSGYSVLATDSIIITDTVTVSGKVGSNGVIKSITTRDSLLENGAGSVTAALTALANEIDNLEQLPYTEINNEALTGTVQSGVYRYNGNATINDTISIEGDSSSYFILIVEGNLTMQHFSCIRSIGIPLNNVMILTTGNLHVTDRAQLNGQLISVGPISGDTLDGELSLKSLHYVNLHNLPMQTVPFQNIDLFYGNVLKATLSGTTNNLAAKPDYFGYNSDCTYQKENLANPTGGFNDPMLLKNIPKLNSKLFRLIYSSNTNAGWDWNDAFFQQPAVQLYHINGGTLPMNEPPDINSFIPFGATQFNYEHFASNRFTDYKLSFDGEDASPMFTFDLMYHDQLYNMKSLYHARDLNIPIKYIDLGNEVWAQDDAFYKRFHNATDYMSTVNSYLFDIHTNFSGAKVAIESIFFGEDNDRVVYDLSDQDRVSKICRSQSWMAAMGLPYVCASCTTNTELHLAAGDALSFHPYINNELYTNNDNSNVPNTKNLHITFAKPFNLIQSFKDNAVKMLSSGIDAWITEYNMNKTGHIYSNPFDHDIAFSGTWAHGLVMAELTMAWMEEDRITHIVCHNLARNVKHAAYFTTATGYAVGDGTVPPDAPGTTAWSLTAEGINMKMIGEAMRHCTLATKIQFPASTPKLKASNYQVLYGWKFASAVGQDMAILMNLDSISHVVQYNFILSGSVGFEQVGAPFDGINVGVGYNPLVYVHSYPAQYNSALYNLSTGNRVTPDLTLITIEGILYANYISLPPYSITRLYQLPGTVTVRTNDADHMVAVNDDAINGVNLINSTGANLNASGAAYYTWNALPSHCLSDGEGSSVTFCPTVSGTYTITVTGRNCSSCSAISSATIYMYAENANDALISSTGMNSSSISAYSFNAAWVGQLANNNTIPVIVSDNCGAGATLTATVYPPNANVQYWWAPAQGLYDASTGGASTIEGAVVYAKPLVNTTYTLTAVDATSGYFSLNTIVVKPAYSFTITSDAANYCGGEPITLTASTGGYNILPVNWYNETQKEVLDVTGFPTIVTLNSTDAGYPHENSIFSAEIIDPNGGCLIKAITPIINISPNLQVNVPKPVICIGENITVTATGAESLQGLYPNITPLAGSYTYAPLTNTNYLIPGSAQSGNAKTHITTTTNCIVTGTVGTNANNGCGDSEAIVPFTINVNGDLPEVTTSPSGTIEIPLGCSIDLTASSNQGSSYFTWYPGTGLDKVTGATVTATPTVNTTYYVLSESTEENEYGCCTTANIIVTVYDYNPVITCSNCTYFCHEGDPELLVSPAVTGATYQWYRSTNNGASYSIISGATNEDYTETVNSCRIYKVVILNSCVYTLYKNVYVNTDPPCDLRLEENDSGKINSATEFICYPNPASNEVNLMINAPDKKLNAAIQVVNMFGQKIYEERIIVNNNYTKQLKQHWNDGVYLIILNTGMETLKQIITIQH